MKSMRIVLLLCGILFLAVPSAVAAVAPVLLPNVPYAFALQMPTPKIDGDLSDWAASGAMALPISLVQKHMDNLPFWTNAADLSAVAYLGWNDEGFYFAAEVQDNVQRQLQTEVNIWQGDCIQFSIDAAFNRSSRYDGDDYEYGLALTPAGPQVQRWAAATGHSTGLVANAKVAVVRDEAAKVTRYEVALPASEVAPAVLAGGTSVGFSWMINEDDGEGRAGWAEWTGGIGASKNPSLYGQLVFLEVKR